MTLKMKMTLTSETRNFVLNSNFAFHNCYLTRMTRDKCPCRTPTRRTEKGGLQNLRIYLALYRPQSVKNQVFLRNQCNAVTSLSLRSQRRLLDYSIVGSENILIQSPPRLQCPEARRHSDPVKALRILQCFYSLELCPFITCTYISRSVTGMFPAFYWTKLEDPEFLRGTRK